MRDQVDPHFPYFFGQLENGVKFAADARDLPGALHAIYPSCNSVLINGLIDCIGGQGGDVLDVGTNIGVVAASLARHIDSRGRVFAFEPSPETFRIAAATLALNEAHNVVLTQSAIGDQGGIIKFNSAPGNSAIASSLDHGFSFMNTWTEIAVHCTSIDDFVDREQISSVSLIKIDVEGAELNVLRGAKSVIMCKRPSVVFEYTPKLAHDLGFDENQYIETFSDASRYYFESLVEPNLSPSSDRDAGASMIPFPLPVGADAQINVFARPF
jgi:FkbM family methyltransferase